MPLDKPFQKATESVTFVGEDGQEIEVVKNISAAGLRILKKQGYKKQSQRHQEQEDAALAKRGGDDEVSTGPDLQVKKAPAKK